METKKEGAEGDHQNHATNQQRSWKEPRPFLWCPIHCRNLWLSLYNPEPPKMSLK